MPHDVCPWWIGYLLLSPVRRLYQSPRSILSPHVRAGMVVVEPGPGMGFFTLDLARLVGDQGKVIAIDLQPRMLRALERRAARRGVRNRIETRLVARDRTGMEDLEGRIDLVFAFAVVHELPDKARFFVAAARALKPGGRLLIAEPRGHVNEASFGRTLAKAEAAALRVVARPAIRGSRTALLEKSEAQRGGP